jgi:hypothetical protein
MNARSNRNSAAPWAPLFVLAGVTAAGCGGGGYSAPPPPPPAAAPSPGAAPAPAPAGALGFQVTPATILLGQTAQLTWTADATSMCAAGGAWSGAQSASGSSNVTPSTPGSVTFLLTCSGGAYSTDQTASVTLTVTAATLAQLQSSVFAPTCTSCHNGSQPPNGALPGSMNLTSAASSFAALVSVPSLEQPTVLRVAPGDPGASYLVHKVEGAPGITGARMPFGGAPLDPARIAEIRSWIAAGAMNN